MIFIDKKKKSRDCENEDATIGCDTEALPRRSFRLSEKGAQEKNLFCEAEAGEAGDFEAEAFETKACENKVSRERTYPRTGRASFRKTSLEKETSQEEKKPEDEAFRAALRILSSGANSSRMLREKLCRKGFSKEDAAAAVERADDAGLIGDRRLFFSHAEYLARKKFYGKNRIRLALMQKFDREIVERFFEEAVEELDFASYAVTLAGRYAGRGREYVIGRLQRAGYASSEIRSALQALEL